MLSVVLSVSTELLLSGQKTLLCSLVCEWCTMAFVTKHQTLIIDVPPSTWSSPSANTRTPRLIIPETFLPHDRAGLGGDGAGAGPRLLRGHACFLSGSWGALRPRLRAVQPPPAGIGAEPHGLKGGWRRPRSRWAPRRAGGGGPGAPHTAPHTARAPRLPHAPASRVSRLISWSV